MRRVRAAGARGRAALLAADAGQELYVVGYRRDRVCAAAVWVGASFRDEIIFTFDLPSLLPEIRR